MKAYRLPGIENEDELRKVIESLNNSIIPARMQGRNNAADLFEMTIDALSQVRFQR